MYQTDNKNAREAIFARCFFRLFGGHVRFGTDFLKT